MRFSAHGAMKFHRFAHSHFAGREGETNHNNSAAFFPSPLVFRNNFHIKNHHFKMICTHVNSYLWKRGRGRSSCHISHSIPFLASVVVVLLLLIKKRYVTNGLEKFSFGLAFSSDFFEGILDWDLLVIPGVCLSNDNYWKFIQSWVEKTFSVYCFVHVWRHFRYFYH